MAAQTDFPSLHLRNFCFARVLILIYLSLVTLWLAACSLGPTPTPTFAPTQTAMPPSCLIGIWEIASPEQFLRAALPVNAFDPAALTYVNRVGSVAYRFDSQGVLTVEAVNFHGRFDVADGDELNLLDIRMNGFASATYQIEGDLVRVIGLKSSDMQFFAYYANDSMMPDTKADSYMPLFVTPFNKARFGCDDRLLKLEFENFPNIDGSLAFNRLR